MKFNFLNPQTEEIINDFYNESVEIATDNLTQKNKNTLFYTTRTKSLILKTLQLLQNIYINKNDNTPLYVLVNVPSTNEAKKIFDKIDLQKLKDCKIKVVFTNTMKIYNDYNYGIPKKANILIISNYKALAEGFRFPRMQEVIFTGKPNDIPTILQASARCFLPGKVFKTDIRLTTAELYTKINAVLPTHDNEKEFLISTFIKNFNTISPSNTFKEAQQLTITEIGMEFQINEEKKSPPKNEIKRLKSLAESIITSLRFIGSEIGGIKTKKSPTKIVKELNENLVKEDKTPSKKIKTKI
jgi:hypothetical protein